MKLSLALAAFGLVAGVAGGSPASAGAGAFTGTVHINCFGCGVSAGTGAFTLFPGGPFWADFWVDEPSAPCPLVGTAQGRFWGSVNGDFTWTRVGSQLDIRTNGVPGEGSFTITSPVGNPCGMTNVEAAVSGTLVF